MSKIPLALIGMGKMGQAIKRLSHDHGFEVIFEINNYNDLINNNINDVQCAIEFSTPTTAFRNIQWCLENKVPVVSGTTGWTDLLPEARRIAAKNEGAFFYASNFSIGMQITFHMNRQLARIMERFPEFDARINETHHIHKADQPSGTAKTLADDIVEGHPRYKRWVLTNGNDQVSESSLPVIARREGEVKGIHEVTYTTPHEEVMLRHEAYDRSIFAAGALLAARWLIGKKGSFTFDDFLNFEISS